jgi:hypothetical protein
MGWLRIKLLGEGRPQIWQGNWCRRKLIEFFVELYYEATNREPDQATWTEIRDYSIGYQKWLKGGQK